GALLVLAPCAPATAGGAPAAVINPAAIAPFFEAALTERVDIVGIGDSNQLFQADGFDHGWHVALAERYGLYATGLITMNSGPNAGDRYQRLGAMGATTGAPAALHRFLDPGMGGILPFKYSYLGDEQSQGGNAGMSINADCPLDVDADLRFHFTYGVFGEGAGAFLPQVRMGVPPWTPLATSPMGIDPGLGAGGMLEDHALDLPAAHRGYSIQYLVKPSATMVQGPFFGLYIRAENLERSAGASYHTLLARGGEGARTFAIDLQQASDEYLTEFFRRVRALQGPTKRVLVRINTGVNDRNDDGLPSVGPIGGYSSDTPEGYADNLQGVIDRIQGIWHLNGWADEELFFLLTASHPISAPDDPEVQTYRAAAAALCAVNPRTASVNFDALISAIEMEALGWYDPAARVHLSLRGYEGMAALELDAIVQAIACPPDFDGDGIVNAADLATLLADWGLENVAADMDGGGVTASDLATLLSYWGPCS
ncbi:MAG: hypothetical protein VYC34_07540, partial [Planctomycetota bacterium]|nr:hypothetical protein [Planctomycetota bacterium]